MRPLVWYFILCNLIGLIMMKNDKKYAQMRKRRISERNLWLTAFVGGALGMFLGMRVYRHKTKHFSFKYGLPILALLDLFIFFFLLDRVS